MICIVTGFRRGGGFYGSLRNILRIFLSLSSLQRSNRYLLICVRADGFLYPHGENLVLLGG